MQNLVKREDQSLFAQKRSSKTKIQASNSSSESTNPRKKKNSVEIKHKKSRDEQYIVTQAKYEPISWTRDQDLIYIRFMKENQELFESQNLRRTQKIFLLLSKLMKGMRSPTQCKSHHQKMQKATNSTKVSDLIMYLENKHSICQHKQISRSKPQKITKLDFSEEFTQLLELSIQVFNIGMQVNLKINFDDIPSW